MKELYRKGIAIIESCKSPTQLDTARNWVSRLRVVGFDSLADKLLMHLQLKDIEQSV